MCSRKPPKRKISIILTTTFVPIKWAALLKGSRESDKIRLRLIPRCTTRYTTRKIPASDINNFFPMEEVRILLI
jgi:hypothetical protein